MAFATQVELDSTVDNDQDGQFERRLAAEPFFSICVPQYDRTSFVLEACRSLVEQDSRDFEVCISDDRSPDGRQMEIVEFLKSSGLGFCFRTRKTNGRYDANLRSAIGLAKGRYCFLLGNDDALANNQVLSQLQSELESAHFPAVAVSNFADFSTGAMHRRVWGSGKRGRGPKVAVAQFRNFSFVSGVILDRRRAQEFATTTWDGSEMYQTFIACRMLASGEDFFAVDRVVIRKDIQVPGESVDSYSRRERLDPCPLVERRLPLTKLGRVVADAIEPYCSGSMHRSLNFQVLLQLLIFTLPFWIFEYRRVQSWKFAAGVCLGMRVRNLGEGVALGFARRWVLRVVHFVVSIVGLAAPIRLFELAKRPLYVLAKVGR